MLYDLSPSSSLHSCHIYIIRYFLQGPPLTSLFHSCHLIFLGWRWSGSYHSTCTAWLHLPELSSVGLVVPPLKLSRSLEHASHSASSRPQPLRSSFLYIFFFIIFFFIIIFFYFFIIFFIGFFLSYVASVYIQVPFTCCTLCTLPYTFFSP